MDSTLRSVILPRWHALNRYRGRAVSGRDRDRARDGRRASEEGDAHVSNIYDCPRMGLGR